MTEQTIVSVAPPKPPAVFNPNEDPLLKGDGLAQFPLLNGAYSVEQYVDVFSQMSAFPAMSKADSSNIPPSMLSYGRLAIMPDPQGHNVLQWPDIPPQLIQKVILDHFPPKLILNMRVADVMRYADYSTHPWKPGWTIETREGLDYSDKVNEAERKAARDFLVNCNIETADARRRDAMGLTNFRTFLASTTRDSLSYDGIAIWTDTDLKGRVKKFSTLSAYNIRLCTKEGYNGDPNIFAVGVDEVNKVVQTFTRYDLVWHVRNPRADARVGGYGYPEIAQALKIIEAMSNAFEMNSETFNKNSIPPGLLKAKGMWTQKQIDVLSRIWQNLKRGVTKSWALPVLPVPKDGDIELLDLSSIEGREVYYQDFINMLAGVLAVLWCFPVDRLGYRTSGRGPENKPDMTGAAPAKMDETDAGLSPLLSTIEIVINEYFIWPRWPNLLFRFTGKSPKEDAREYELRTLAMTVDERRAFVGLPKLSESDGINGEQKEIAEIAGMGPIDPAINGTFQALAVAYFNAKYAPKPAPGGDSEKPQGAPFTSKKDPAESENHGATSGVRRDSAAESASAGEKDA